MTRCAKCFVGELKLKQGALHCNNCGAVFDLVEANLTKSNADAPTLLPAMLRVLGGLTLLIALGAGAFWGVRFAAPYLDAEPGQARTSINAEAPPPQTSDGFVASLDRLAAITPPFETDATILGTPQPNGVLAASQDPESARLDLTVWSRELDAASSSATVLAVSPTDGIVSRTPITTTVSTQKAASVSLGRMTYLALVDSRATIVTAYERDDGAIWSRTLEHGLPGATGVDMPAPSITTFKDGVVVVAPGLGPGEMRLVRLSSAGDVMWNEPFDASTTGGSPHVAAWGDIGVYVAGATREDGVTQVAFIDENGEMIWSSPLASRGEGRVTAAQADEDGRFYVASSGFAPALAAFDPDGSKVWASALPPAGIDAPIRLAVREDALVVAASFELEGTGRESWAAIYDRDGELQRDSFPTLTGDDDARAVFWLSDDAVLLVGDYRSDEFADMDVFIYRLPLALMTSLGQDEGGGVNAEDGASAPAGEDVFALEPEDAPPLRGDAGLTEPLLPEPLGADTLPAGAQARLTPARAEPVDLAMNQRPAEVDRVEADTNRVALPPVESLPVTPVRQAPVIPVSGGVAEPARAEPVADPFAPGRFECELMCVDLNFANAPFPMRKSFIVDNRADARDLVSISTPELATLCLAASLAPEDGARPKCERKSD